MTRGLIFWVLMLLWFVFGILWQVGLVGAFGPLGGFVLLFVLFSVVGWQIFGPPIRG